MFGSWDDTKAEENIDFMPTILSRFDMIFIVRDRHDEARDMVYYFCIVFYSLLIVWALYCSLKNRTLLLKFSNICSSLVCLFIADFCGILYCRVCE